MALKTSAVKYIFYFCHNPARLTSRCSQQSVSLQSCTLWFLVEASQVCVRAQVWITCTSQPLAADTPPQPAEPPVGTRTDTPPSRPQSSESGSTREQMQRHSPQLCSNCTSIVVSSPSSQTCQSRLRLLGVSVWSRFLPSGKLPPHPLHPPHPPATVTLCLPRRGPSVFSFHLVLHKWALIDWRC